MVRGTCTLGLSSLWMQMRPCPEGQTRYSWFSHPQSSSPPVRLLLVNPEGLPKESHKCVCLCPSPWHPGKEPFSCYCCLAYKVFQHSGALPTYSQESSQGPELFLTMQYIERPTNGSLISKPPLCTWSLSEPFLCLLAICFYKCQALI